MSDALEPHIRPHKHDNLGVLTWNVDPGNDNNLIKSLLNGYVNYNRKSPLCDVISLRYSHKINDLSGTIFYNHDSKSKPFRAAWAHPHPISGSSDKTSNLVTMWYDKRWELDAAYAVHDRKKNAALFTVLKNKYYAAAADTKNEHYLYVFNYALDSSVTTPSSGDDDESIIKKLATQCVKYIHKDGTLSSSTTDKNIPVYRVTVSNENPIGKSDTKVFSEYLWNHITNNDNSKTQLFLFTGGFRNKFKSSTFSPFTLPNKPKGTTVIVPPKPVVLKSSFTLKNDVLGNYKKLYKALTKVVDSSFTDFVFFLPLQKDDGVLDVSNQNVPLGPFFNESDTVIFQYFLDTCRNVSKGTVPLDNDFFFKSLPSYTAFVKGGGPASADVVDVPSDGDGNAGHTEDTDTGTASVSPKQRDFLELYYGATSGSKSVPDNVLYGYVAFDPVHHEKEHQRLKASGSNVPAAVSSNVKRFHDNRQLYKGAPMDYIAVQYKPVSTVERKGVVHMRNVLNQWVERQLTINYTMFDLTELKIKVSVRSSRDKVIREKQITVPTMLTDPKSPQMPPQRNPLGAPAATHHSSHHFIVPVRNVRLTESIVVDYLQHAHKDDPMYKGRKYEWSEKVSVFKNEHGVKGFLDYVKQSTGDTTLSIDKLDQERLFDVYRAYVWHRPYVRDNILGSGYDSTRYGISRFLRDYYTYWKYLVFVHGEIEALEKSELIYSSSERYVYDSKRYHKRKGAIIDKICGLMSKPATLSMFNVSAPGDRGAQHQHSEMDAIAGNIYHVLMLRSVVETTGVKKQVHLVHDMFEMNLFEEATKPAFERCGRRTGDTKDDNENNEDVDEDDEDEDEDDEDDEDDRGEKVSRKKEYAKKNTDASDGRCTRHDHHVNALYEAYTRMSEHVDKKYEGDHDRNEENRQMYDTRFARIRFNPYVSPTSTSNADRNYDANKTTCAPSMSNAYAFDTYIHEEWSESNRSLYASSQSSSNVYYNDLHDILKDDRGDKTRSGDDHEGRWFYMKEPRFTDSTVVDDSVRKEIMSDLYRVRGIPMKSETKTKTKTKTETETETKTGNTTEHTVTDDDLFRECFREYLLNMGPASNEVDDKPRNALVDYKFKLMQKYVAFYMGPIHSALKEIKARQSASASMSMSMSASASASASDPHEEAYHSLLNEWIGNDRIPLSVVESGVGRSQIRNNMKRHTFPTYLKTDAYEWTYNAMTKRHSFSTAHKTHLLRGWMEKRNYSPDPTYKENHYNHSDIPDIVPRHLSREEIENYMQVHGLSPKYKYNNLTYNEPETDVELESSAFDTMVGPDDNQWFNHKSKGRGKGKGKGKGRGSRGGRGTRRYGVRGDHRGLREEQRHARMGRYRANQHTGICQDVAAQPTVLRRRHLYQDKHQPTRHSNLRQPDSGVLVLLLVDESDAG